MVSANFSLLTLDAQIFATILEPLCVGAESFVNNLKRSFYFSANEFSTAHSAHLQVAQVGSGVNALRFVFTLCTSKYCDLAKCEC